MRTGKYKLSNGVLGSGNGAVDAKLCLERPIWPRLPNKGVTQWWGRPIPYTKKIVIWQPGDLERVGLG